MNDFARLSKNFFMTRYPFWDFCHTRRHFSGTNDRQRLSNEIIFNSNLVSPLVDAASQIPSFNVAITNSGKHDLALAIYDKRIDFQSLRPRVYLHSTSFLYFHIRSNFPHEWINPFGGPSRSPRFIWQPPRLRPDGESIHSLACHEIPSEDVREDLSVIKHLPLQTLALCLAETLMSFDPKIIRHASEDHRTPISNYCYSLYETIRQRQRRVFRSLRDKSYA